MSAVFVRQERRERMIRPGAAELFLALSLLFQSVASQYSGCTNGTMSNIGDGRCDDENNNPFCGFDGGDVSDFMFNFCVTLRAP